MCTYSGSELEGSEKFFLQEPDLTDVHLSWCYGCTSILREESLLCAQLRADEAEASNLERLNPHAVNGSDVISTYVAIQIYPFTSKPTLRLQFRSYVVVNIDPLSSF